MFCVWGGGGRLVTTEMQTSFSIVLEISQHTLLQLKAAKNMTSLKQRVFLSFQESGLWPQVQKRSPARSGLGKECHLITKIIFLGTSQRRGQRHLHVPMTSLGPALHSRGEKNCQGKFPVYLDIAGPRPRLSTLLPTPANPNTRHGSRSTE